MNYSVIGPVLKIFGLGRSKYKFCRHGALTQRTDRETRDLLSDANKIFNLAVADGGYLPYP